MPSNQMHYPDMLPSDRPVYIIRVKKAPKLVALTTRDGRPVTFSSQTDANEVLRDTDRSGNSEVARIATYEIGAKALVFDYVNYDRAFGIDGAAYRRNDPDFDQKANAGNCDHAAQDGGRHGL